MADMTVGEIIDLLSRKTVDGQAVEKTLIHASARNFNTLYNIQRNLVSIKRFDVPINDLDRVYKLGTDRENQHYPHRYVHRIPSTFISGDARKKCKKNGLYGVPLSQEFISDRPDIFDFNFMIFIEGRFIDTGEVIVKDGETIFVLDVSAGDDTRLTDGIPLKDFDAYSERNSVVTFITLPNYTMSVASFNIYTFQDVMKRVVRLSRFSGNCNFSQDKTMYLMNVEEDHVSSKSIVRVTYDEENKTITIPEDIPVSSTKLSIVAISTPDIHSSMVVEPGEVWFDLSRLKYPMPLPTENILAFSFTENGISRFVNDVKISLYYPNIYKTESSEYLTLLFFYNVSDITPYHNELELLDLLTENLTERYANGTLPDFIKEYKPLDYKWLTDSESYRTSIYYPKRSLYNVNAMKQLALRSPHFLIEYLYCKLKSLPKYYINVSKITDLEDRIRMDTCKECQDTGDIVYLKEPCYIFSLRKKFVGSFGVDFRLFIDNRFLPPLDYTFIIAVDYYHFYIPVKYINPDSVIEVEKYVEFENNRRIIFDSLDTDVEISLLKHIKKSYARNILLIDNESGLFLQPGSYRVTAYNDITESEIPLDTRGYATVTGSFKLALLDEKYLNKPLTLKFSHRLVTKTKRANEFDVNEVPATVPFDNNSDMDVSRLRVFVNGLMLPSKMYGLVTDGHYMGDTRVQLFTDVALDADRYDPVTIDVLPVGQTCEFYKETIENEYGFVDTGNALSLPLDLKWYDIYVNGLKLNRTNVEIVTSNKFFVKGISTRKNLCIYARHDIYDEFDVLHDEATENEIFAQVDDIYKELIKDKDLLGDDMEDITEGLLENIAKHMKFVNEILEYSFINANEQQVTPEIRAMFPELIDEHGILWLDSNTYPDARCVTMINSNIRSDIMKNDQYRYGWVPLHIGSHEDAKDGEYLCDPITGAPGMKNQDGSVIPTGELDRLTIHKTNLLTAMMNNGLSSNDIYQIQFDQNTTSREVIVSENILDDGVDMSGTYVGKMILSLDLQVLKRGYMDVMTYSSVIPTVEICYVSQETIYTKRIPYNDLSSTVIEINAFDFQINSISLVEAEEMNSVKCILHSILLSV